MSFCPTKDIHSVYLDNELPNNFKVEYENHLKICPKCQKQLGFIKKTSEAFHSDALFITPDSHYVDESFNRLMIKMNYSKNTNKSHKNDFSFKNFSYLVSAAAVGIFALLLPLGFFTNSQKINQNQTNFVNPILTSNSVNSVAPFITNSNNVSFNSGKSVVVFGNIEDKVLTSMNVKNNISSVNLSKKINDFEVLRPGFTENEIIQARIKVPQMNEIPIFAQINFSDRNITFTFGN